MPQLALPIVEPELAEPLGHIVIRWSTVEYMISLLLATFLRADLGGMQLVMNNIATSTQSKWLKGLMDLHPHEVASSARVRTLLDRIDDLRAERNEFVHGQWDTTNCEPRTALIQTVNLDRQEIIRTRLVTVHDLNQLLVEIDDWLADYVTLGRELGFPRKLEGTKSIFVD